MRESLVKRHYDHLRAGKLVAHRCRACSALTFPGRSACASCGTTAWTEVELSGRGTLLYASNNLAPPPHPRFAAIAPYVYGHILLEEGLTTQGIVLGVEPEPEALRKLYERGPVPCKMEVLPTDDLPVAAYRIEVRA